MMLSFMRIRPHGTRSDNNQQAVGLDIERQQQTAGDSRLNAFNAFEQQTAAAPATAAPHTVLPPSQAVPAASTQRASRRVRLERDANATLFGPSLANYFPLSASSNATSASATDAIAAAAAAAAAAATATATATAAENGTSANDTADQAQTTAGQDSTSNTNANTAPPAFAPLTTVSSISSVTLRRPRLGASGRARGASLSNLSVASLVSPTNQTPNIGGTESPLVGSPNPTSSAVENTVPSYGSRPAFPVHRRQYTTDSAWSIPGQDRAENDEDIDDDGQDREEPGKDFGPLSLADAIQLGTLHRWLRRAAGGGGATLHPNSIPQPADAISPVSTPSQGAIMDANGQENIPLSNLGTTISPGALSVCTILQSYVNLKRNTFRLTLGPAAARPEGESAGALSANSSTPPTLPAHVLTPAPSAPILAHPTHILHFEYDSAAPRCAIHVFVRASRKHGSWNQAMSHPDFPYLLSKSASSQSGSLLSPHAPPHILGFPILAATTIAPGSTSDHSTQAVVTSTGLPSESHHLPLGFAQKRSVALRLDMSLYAPPSFNNPSQDKEDGIVEGGKDGAHQNVTAGISAGASKVEEEKEKGKSDNNKARADKETLKVTIVVEALDENGKPLSQPNLQTTYLRLTSVPAPAGSAAAVAGSDGKMRVWSAQVEAQEAEIGPHRFQLQELFGLSTRPPPASLVPADPAAGDTAVTEGAGGAEPGEGEGEGTEIPTEVPAGSTHNLNGSSDGLVRTTTSNPVPTTTSGGYMPPLDGGTTGSECLICLTSPPSTLLLPCTHGLCLECAVQLRESVKNARDAERRRGKVPRRKYACPVCRRAYTSMLHLSTADEKHVAQASAHGVV
ncbi:hypothetical protein CF327_g3340 [Tilletia walkeri]|nr:hypothetical protein CF327_g3340 [Tilletia walkeri]